MRPYLETLFRNPLLLVLPALILPALVFIASRSMPTSYNVSATLWIDNSTVPPQVQQGVVQTVASLEAQALRERLSTLAFRVQIINESQLTGPVDALQWPKPQPPATWLARVPLMKPVARVFHGTRPKDRNEAWKRALNTVQSSIRVKTDGNNLVTITYIGPDAELGKRMVQAAQGGYLAEKAAATKRKLDEVTAIKDPIISGVQAEADSNRQAFQEYRATLSLTPTLPQQQRLSDLQSYYDDANNRLQALKLSQAQSTLVALSGWTDQSHSLLLVDGPVSPAVPAYGLKHIVLLSFAAGILGLVLGGMLVILRTWLVQTVRVGPDVALRLRAPAIDTIPVIKTRKLRSGTW